MTTPADLRLGPLTTTFTAPPECKSITVSVDGSTGDPYVYPRRFASIAKSCFPSGFPLGNAALTSTYGVYGYHDEHVYYSPGLCPSGWLKNTVSVSTSKTTAFCCPPGFNPETLRPVDEGASSSNFCSSNIASTVITTVAYTGDGEEDGFSSTYTFIGASIPAPAIWIRYKDGDFASSTVVTTSSASVSSSSSSLSSSITQTSSLVNNTTSSPGPMSTPSSGLSTGAKIGTGVGIPLAVVIAVINFAFTFIRRRRQQRSVDVAGNEGGKLESEFKNQADLTGGGVRPTSELPAGDVGEIAFVGRSELEVGIDAGLPVSELEAK